MIAATALAVITVAGLWAWWRLRHAAGHRSKLDRILDAWEAENADACDAALRVIVARTREDGPQNLAWPPDDIDNWIAAWTAKYGKDQR